MTAGGLSVLEPWIRQLGWVLVHFVWQGAVVGAVYGLARLALAEAGPRWRYAAAFAALVALAGLPVATWLALQPTPAAVHHWLPVAPAAAGFAPALTAWAPAVVAGWLAGVLVLALRLARDWLGLRRLVRSHTSPLPPAPAAAVAALGPLFGIAESVRVRVSERIRVPMLVGWLRPVVLIPPSALLGLTPRQLELIVAHEFGHLARRDHLVNLFQVVVETVLFYHPVVHWVSRDLRRERELCCDDLVVARTGDSLGYARALAEMEMLRAQGVSLQIAVNGGDLLVRIRRLVARRPAEQGRVRSFTVLVGLVLALAANGTYRWVAHDPAAQSDGDEAAPPAPVVVVAAPPIRRVPAASVFAPSVADRSATGAAGQAPATSAAARPAADVSTSQRPAAKPPAPESPAPEPAPVRAPPPLPALAAIEVTARRRAVPTPARDEPPPPVWAGGEPLRTPAPRFPQRALYGGIEGWVQVAFDVGADGDVDDVEIVEAYPKGVFERAATRAVARWEFEPYTLDGVPTARRVAHTIDFLLEDGAMLAEADGCRTVTGSRICLGQRLGIEDLERGLVMQRADAR